MRTKKKRLGTKVKIRVLKEREKRIVTAIFLAFILLMVIFSAYFIYTILRQPQNQTSNPTSELKAAIVDQASLSPAGGFNETFVNEATNLLGQAGYTVDYCSGEKVTVEFYRNLPTHGYSLIILRVHAAVTEGSQSLGIFTSERYDKTKYTYEQLTERLAICVYSQLDRESGITYFGIRSGFVTSGMNGRFENTVIIMTGCEGLTYPAIAEAFIQKGAKVYIGWDKGILFSHTDTATIHLLQHLIIEKQTIEQAVTETMKEVGPDPIDGSVLRYYPNT